MKKVGLLIICLLPALISLAQRDDLLYYWPQDDETQKYTFTEVVHMRNLKVNIETLYASAKMYVGKMVMSNNDSSTIDEAMHSVSYKGRYVIPVPQLGERGNGFVTYRLTLTCGHQSYKYTITDLEHYAAGPDDVFGGALENDKAACGGKLFPRLYWEQLKAKCYYNIQTTIESIKEYMMKHAVMQ